MTTARQAKFVVLASLVAWIGCSAKNQNRPPLVSFDGDAAPPIVGGSSGGNTDAAIDANLGEGGADCNALTFEASGVIAQQEVAEAPPVPVGGIISDGTYFLTRDTIYLGPGGTSGATGMSLQEVQVFSGGSIEVLAQGTVPSPLLRRKGTYSLNSSTNDAGISTTITATFAYSCPANAGSETFAYSVTGTSLLEFISATEVLTFIQQ
jgi:hypothetical protein